MQLLKLKSFLGSYTKSYSLYHKYASQIEVQGNLYDLKHWITPSDTQMKRLDY